MKTAFVNGTIITGDGKTVLKKSSVLVDGDKIKYVGDNPDRSYVQNSDKRVDLRGRMLLPGLINSHAHGFVIGPGHIVVSAERDVIRNLNKHLLHGVTTILSLEGTVTYEEFERSSRLHPINVKTATRHTPANMQAEKVLVGDEVTDVHMKTTLTEMIEKGAAAIGEIGGGTIMGGAVQDYLCIPEALKKRTKVYTDMPGKYCKLLRVGALGHDMDPSRFNPKMVKDGLQKLDISHVLSVEDARKLVEDLLLPQYRLAIQGYKEGVQAAADFNMPVLLHSGPSAWKVMLELAPLGRNRMIALHAPSGSHLGPEYRKRCFDTMKKLREQGVVIEACTLDMITTHKTYGGPEPFLELFRRKLTDIVTTDWGGGHFDSQLSGLQLAIDKKLVDLPSAVRMATSRVGEVVPKLAPNRGLIAEGKIADLVVVGRKDISDVQMVVIGGEAVVEEGKITKKSIIV